MNDFEMSAAGQEGIRRYLQSVFEYESETGNFVRKVATTNSVIVGEVAGTIGAGGYRKISIEGRYFQASRLVWLLFFGHFPAFEVDHINGTRTDNRLSNLRLATHSQNACNQKRRTTNTSGVKGVSLVKRTGKWRADIVVDGEHVYLGQYSSLDTAQSIIRESRRVFHQSFANDGRHSRDNSPAVAE